jgi:hypothetical protein
MATRQARTTDDKTTALKIRLKNYAKFHLSVTCGRRPLVGRADLRRGGRRRPRR